MEILEAPAALPEDLPVSPVALEEEIPEEEPLENTMVEQEAPSAANTLTAPIPKDAAILAFFQAMGLFGLDKPEPPAAAPSSAASQEVSLAPEITPAITGTGRYKRLIELGFSPAQASTICRMEDSSLDASLQDFLRFSKNYFINRATPPTSEAVSTLDLAVRVVEFILKLRAQEIENPLLPEPTNVRDGKGKRAKGGGGKDR